MYSQWDRKIDDQLLYKILPFIECTNCEKDVVIAFPSFLSEKGIASNKRNCLIIVIKQKLLITAYWCDNPNYLFNKFDNPHFQLLY